MAIEPTDQLLREANGDDNDKDKNRRQLFQPPEDPKPLPKRDPTDPEPRAVHTAGSLLDSLQTPEQRATTPWDLVGQERSNRRLRVQHADGTHTFYRWNGLSIKKDDQELDPELRMIAEIMTLGQVAKIRGGYKVAPKPIFGPLDTALEKARDVLPDVLERPLLTGTEFVRHGIRALLSRVGIEGPEEVEEFLGPGGLPPDESLEVARQTGSPQFVDITDPAADISLLPDFDWEEFKSDPANASTVKLYRARRALDGTLRGAFITPLTNRLLGGEAAFTREGAQASGELAPPRDKTDAAIDLIANDIVGPLLPSVALFGPLTLPGRAFGASAAGQATARAIGTPGRITTIGALGGAGAGAGAGFIGSQFTEANDTAALTAGGALAGAAGIAGLARHGLRLAGSERAFVEAFAARAPQIFGSLGSEAALGAGFTGAYGAAAAYETGRPEDAAKAGIQGALTGTMLGFGFALPFRTRALSQISRVSQVVDNLQKGGLFSLRKGDILNRSTGLRYGGQRSNGTPIWQIQDPETGGIRFARKEEYPTSEAVHDYLIDTYTNAAFEGNLQDRLGDTLVGPNPQAEALQARQHTRQGAEPLDPQNPQQLSETEELARLVSQAEIDYFSVAKSRATKDLVNRDREAAYQGAINIYKLLAETPGVELFERAHYLGRARAMERARAEFIQRGRIQGDFQSPEQLKGTQDFAMERFVREQLQAGELDVLSRNLAMAEARAASASATPAQKSRAIRFRKAFDRQLNETQLPNMEAQIKARLKDANFAASRGLTRGSTVIHEGQTATVLKKAWGSAQIQKAGDGPIWVLAETLDIVPKVGRFVLLEDQTPVKVLRHSADKTQTLVRRPDGQERWIPQERIFKAGDNPQFSEIHEKVFNTIQQNATEGTLQPKGDPVEVPERSVINRTTGEEILVRQETTEELIGINRRGQTRVIPKSQSLPVRSMEVRASGRPEVFAFTAGTKPREGRVMTYVELPEDEAARFQAAFELGGDKTILADMAPEGRIFPTNTPGTRLFAVERVSKRGHLSKEAKQVLGILSGKKDAGTIVPEDVLATTKLTQSSLEDAIIYEVPQALREHIRPFESLKTLHQDDIRTYLRKLTDLSFEINPAAQAAKTKGQQAFSRRQEALRKGDGGAVNKAEREIEQAQLEIVFSELEQNEVILSQVADAHIERLKSGPVGDVQFSRLLEDGDPEAIRQFLKELPADPGTFGANRIVLEHSEIPGVELVITKQARRSYDPRSKVQRTLKIDEPLAEELGIFERPLPGEAGPGDIAQQPGLTRAAQVIPESEFIESPEWVVEAVVDGEVAQTFTIRNDNQTRTTDIPAAPAAGTPTREGDRLLAYRRDVETGRTEVIPVEVQQVLAHRGATPKRTKVEAAGVDVEAIRQKHGLNELETLTAPETQPQVRNAIEDLNNELRNVGLRPVDFQEALKALEGKSPKARRESIRSQLTDEGKARFDEIEGELEADAISRAQFEEAVSQLPQQFPVGQSKILLVDSRNGQPFYGSPGEATRGTFSNIILRRDPNLGRDVLPGQVYDSQGRTVHLVRSTDPALAIERRNVARTPAQLEQLRRLANAKEAAGEAVALRDVEFPVFLTDDQVINTLMQEFQNFERKLKLKTPGNEWRSPWHSGFYATIYRGTQARPGRAGEWLVNFWRRPAARPDPLAVPAKLEEGTPTVKTKDPLIELSDPGNAAFLTQRSFPSRQAAERFLQDEGFIRPDPPASGAATSPRRSFIAQGGPGEAPPRTPSQEAVRAIETLHETIRSFMADLPEGVTAREALGDFDLTKASSKGGISSNDLAAQAGDPTLARSFQTTKGNITKIRKQLLDIGRRLNLEGDNLRRLVLGTREEAISTLPTEARVGIAARLDDLPHWDFISKGDLNKIEHTLVEAWQWYSHNNNGWVPPELKNYMMRFANRRAALAPDLKDPPFTFDIRRKTGIIAEGDPVRIQRVQRGADTGELPHRIDAEPDPQTTMEGLDVDSWDLLPGRRIVAQEPPISSEQRETITALKRFHDGVVDNAPFMRQVDDAFDPSDPSKFGPVAEITTEGRNVLVQVVSRSDDFSQAYVRTVEGKFHWVPWDELSVKRGADATLDFVTQSKLLKNEPVFIERTAKPGRSPLDKALTIRRGMSPTEVRSRLIDRVDQLLGVDNPEGRVSGLTGKRLPSKSEAPVQFTPKGQRLAKDVEPAVAKELVNLHIRAVELGHPDAITSRMPSRFRNGLKRLAYDQIIRTKGDSPTHILEAMVKSDLAKKKQLTALAEWAQEHGITSKNPIDQVDQLVGMSKVNPDIGDLIVSINKQAGFVRLFGSGDSSLDHRLVDFQRIGSRGDIKALGHWYNSPDYVASRHPAAESFFNEIFYATAREQRGFENAVLNPVHEIMSHYRLGTGQQMWDFIKTGQSPIKGFRKNYNRIKAIRALANEHATWDDVLKANPDVDPELRKGFDMIRDMQEGLRLKTIQHSLRQGRRWVRFGDLDPTRQAMMARNFQGGLSTIKGEVKAVAGRADGTAIKDIDPDLMVVDPSIHMSDRRSRQEVEQFTELLRQFDSSEALPPELHKNLPEWMVEEFDLWKNYGIDNYWPYIHRGRIIVEALEGDGSTRTIAWARSGVEAVEAVRILNKEGKIRGDQKVSIRSVGTSFDDVMAQMLTREQMQKMSRGIQRLTNLEAVDVADVLSGAGFKQISAQTKLAHAKERVADLQGIIDNPLQELTIYGARVYRNSYLMDIDDAYTWMKQNQRKLSEAFNMSDLDELPHMASFIDDVWRTAKGEPGYVEEFLDAILNTQDWLAAKPKILARLAKEKGLTGLFDPELRANFTAESMFSTPFRSRQFSSSVASAHGFFKLAMTPSSALVNLSQLGINTWPILGEKFFYSGINEYSGLYKGTLNPDKAIELNDMLSAIGVKWQRSVAGARAGLVDFQTAPGTGLPAPGRSKAFEKLKSLQRPLTAKNLGQGVGLAQTWDAVNHFGMYFFEGAETVNRSITAIGAYNKAITPKTKGGLGLSKEAATQFAFNTVKQTQFLYFDTALPKLLRGPGAKIAAQFKPYLYNQMRFEMDLFKTAFLQGNRESQLAFVKHAAALLGLGGFRALFRHPILGPLIAFGGWAFGSGDEDLPRLYGEPRNIAENWPIIEDSPNMSRPASWIAKDVFNHGLPALLGMSISDRVGISATDLTQWGDIGFWAGPHGSLMGDLARWELEQIKAGSKGPAVGALTATGIKALLSSPGKPLPAFSLILPALAAQDLFASLSGDPATQAFAINNLLTDPFGPSDLRESNVLRRQVLPKFLNDVERFANILLDGVYYDAAGAPVPVPLHGLGRLQAAGNAMFGFRSVNDVERTAYEQLHRNETEIYTARKRVILETIAANLHKGNWERAMQLRAAGEQEGFIFEDENIDTALRRRQESRTRQLIRNTPSEVIERVEGEPEEP